MSLVITGASGTLGRLVPAELAGEDLILLTRDPGKLDAPDATVRRFDFHAAAPEAFAGATRMLLISGDKIGEPVAAHKEAIDAAVAAGVGFIAYTSIPNPSDNNPIVVAAEHRATEEHIRASGAAWCFLRNNIYTEMMRGPLEQARSTGKLVTNGGPVGLVARADCAAAAAAVLAGEGHEGREYDITGPAAVTPEDLAAIFSAVSGRPVAGEHVSDDALGIPPVYASFGRGARLGCWGVVSTAVRRLTGREPLSAREVLSA